MRKLTLYLGQALLFGVLAASFTAHAQDLKPGAEFKDCEDCPTMVVIPAGEFMMGAPSDTGLLDDSMPDKKLRNEKILLGRSNHQVPIKLSKPYAMAKFELSPDEYVQCERARACPRLVEFGLRFCEGDKCQDLKPIRRPFSEDKPQKLDFVAAQAFVKWLSEKTGRTYRLPSEAEWEFAARGGTTTRFWWGPKLKFDMMNCRDCLSVRFMKKHNMYLFGRQDTKVLPVGQFSANPFGLHDVLGNLAEWVADCSSDSHEGADENGAPRVTCVSKEKLSLRGGGYFSAANNVATYFRDRTRGNSIFGLRVLAELK